jgi:hypothetical protein
MSDRQVCQGISVKKTKFSTMARSLASTALPLLTVRQCRKCLKSVRGAFGTFGISSVSVFGQTHARLSLKLTPWTDLRHSPCVR